MHLASFGRLSLQMRSGTDFQLRESRHIGLIQEDTGSMCAAYWCPSTVEGLRERHHVCCSDWHGLQDACVAAVFSAVHRKQRFIGVPVGSTFPSTMMSEGLARLLMAFLKWNHGIVEEFA
jgi:hypothetical protein